MKLYAAVASPFVRKVRMAMALRGLDRDIALHPTNTNDPADALHGANPLGKMPALELDDGTALYDSRVIVEYIDSIGTAGTPLLPAGPDRWRALRLQALADGMCDAAILCIYESRYRPEERRHAPWVDRQWHRVEKALEVLEAAPPPGGAPATIGEVALAAALGYLDFRFEGKWRDGHPRLVAWLDEFAGAVPAFAATAPD
jgi:glutathione S-transferase